MSVTSGLVAVAGGFSQSISAGSEKRPDGSIKRLQFRLKIAIPESYGPPQARKALALSRLADIVAMRDALVEVGRGAQAAYLMRRAGAVADDPEKFSFAIAAANVVMTRPSEKASEASTRFVTWGQLARAWSSQELARLYPNAGYGKKSAEATDEPRIEYLCKYIADVPLATFNDDDYWRAMRPARQRCKTDSTFKAYAQVARRVLKIAVELRIVPAWPLSAVCKLPIVHKGEAPEFPFLYPEEYARLMRCAEVPLQYRVLWGFIIREGLRLGEAYRIRWEHLAQLPPQAGLRPRWVLNVPETKTGRALMFVLNAGTGEVLEAFKALRPDLAGPFVWLSATNLKKAADTLRRHIEQSGTSRERLLFTEGRLRRLREHDLRSTFVSWCKLAGVDNETIAQHTGHESNTMIARYNRSKATIEHLGLAPYLPLDQAMGLDGSGELGAGRVLGPDGAGELLLGEGAQPDADAATGEGSCNQQPAEPPCPDCDRPMARVRSAGGRNGWTCPGCNAAGDAEGDWLEPEGDALELDGEGIGAPLTAEGCRECGMRAPVDRGHAPGCSGGASNERAKEEPIAVDYSGEGGANLVHRGAEPLNACNGRDASRDAHSGEGCAPVPPDGETSLIDARCARRDSNSHSVRNRNLNPAFGDRRKQNPDKPGGEPAPERTGTDRASHPAVTQPGEGSASSVDGCARRDSNPHSDGNRILSPGPADGNERNQGKPGGDPAPEAGGNDRASRPAVTLLDQLQAAHRSAAEDRNWAAARALEPLIDAEVARLAEAARAAPPEPVRLEVVRARRDERGQR